MRVRQILITIVLLLMVVIPSVNAAYGYYTIPVMALTNSPADSVTNYFGNRPIVPVTVGGNNKVYIPTTGIIERAEIYDYSGTAGTNQAYTYYIRINNVQDYPVQTLSVATNERRFTNSTINIPVSAGDYFEVKRVHPVWTTRPLTNIVGGYVAINATTEPGFVMPFMQLTSSPADAAWNYMNFRPVAMSTSANLYALDSPSGGNITKVNIYDNSSGAQPGTAEAISYYVQVNEGSEELVSTVSVAIPERIFTNNAMAVNVTAGDSIEFKRLNPTWVTNPLLNIVGGTAFINTQYEPTTTAKGYPLFIQSLSATPADTTPYYVGNLPKAPVTTAGTSKVYIPKAGTINKAYLNVYASTVGTGEVWSHYIVKNGVGSGYLIETVLSRNAVRTFSNQTIGLSVIAGDYIEIKAIPPVWVTNPVCTYSGYVYIDYTTPTGGGGGDIILPPVSDFSANLTPASKPAVIQFFDQSNNTVPGTTLYYWNFTNGGTGVDSTDINPSFTYTTNGAKTVNHTVSSGGVVSKATKTVTITGGTATAAPQAYFNITLTDTSTEYPASWQWNATNLTGNNVEFTFSTAQNPKLELGTGNWLIKLNVTNAFGSNSTTQNIGWNLSSPLVHFWSRTG